MSCLTAEILEKIWRLSDKDRDGHLTEAELHAGMNEYLASQGKPPVSYEFVKCHFSGLDHSGDGKVSKEEYFEELHKRGDREEGIRKEFLKASKASKDDGIIDKDEFRQLVVKLKICKPENVDLVTDYIYKKADTDGKEGISYEEFRAAMDKF